MASIDIKQIGFHDSVGNLALNVRDGHIGAASADLADCSPPPEEVAAGNGLHSRLRRIFHRNEFFRSFRLQSWTSQNVSAGDNGHWNLVFCHTGS